MNRITSPLQQGNHGATVTDLQGGLRFLMDKGNYRFQNQRLSFIEHSMEK